MFRSRWGADRTEYCVACRQPKVNLIEGEKLTQGFVYVGEAMDGTALLCEENLPEVVCARLAAPEMKERGIGESRSWSLSAPPSF